MEIQEISKAGLLLKVRKFQHDNSKGVQNRHKTISFELKVRGNFVCCGELIV